MRKALLAIVVLAAAAAGTYYYLRMNADTGAAAAPAAGAGPGAGTKSGPGGGRGNTALMTVDTAAASRQEVIEYVTVVGNLIGEATVDVSPRVNGRIESIAVKLGDRVAKGQLIAKMDDRDVKEQVKQAEASLELARATARQREFDMTASRTTFERQKNLYDRQLQTKQTLEDAEARYNASAAQVDVAKAQVMQTQARLDELKVTLGNTIIQSPVDGFVGRRTLDPGAFAGANTPVVSVVDIDSVRLIANLVEKDFRRVTTGVEAMVEVDAFPGETFMGKVSRVAPIFDAATRTATLEIEVPNPGYRLKPGMYARVRLTVDRRPDALTVPRNAVVDSEGKRGVFLIDDGNVARFNVVRTGLQDADRVEILEGLNDGQRVITTGAMALRNGDRVQLVNGRGGRRGGGAGGGGGKSPAPAGAGK
ncbi:MAG: efflux RND transporter periplasmic adaptor subunit [Acidobacteria bacterium]|nr:MAG: efflux RND transporter periplasmic adaptor subunit [Acidobacteriota bacterium]